jgi:hypothetical protein
MPGSENIEIRGATSFDLVDGKEQIDGQNVDLREILKKDPPVTEDEDDDTVPTE